MATVEGDHAAARTLYEESLAVAREVGYQLLIVSCLEGVAGVLAAQGASGSAARLWGAAAALRDAIGAPLPSLERGDYEHAVAEARTQLGEAAFAATWAEGRSMTPEQALAAANQ